MFIPRLSLLAAPFLLVTAGLVQADEPFVEMEIPAAFAQAEEDGKVVVLFFHEAAERSSVRMLTQTFGNEDVRKWLATNAVSLLIPPSNGKALTRFQVNTFPYTVILDGSGKVLHRIDGDVDAPDFLLDSQTALLALGGSVKPSGANEDSAIAWLAYANYLFANEPAKADECSRTYFFCLDKGEGLMAGFRERYFEFILERLSYLKQRSEAGLEGLFSRRQDLRGRISAGTASEREAYEYVRYNYWLRDQHLTVELFQELGQFDTPGHDACRRVLLFQELRRMVDNRLYEDVLTMIPMPQEHISGRFAEYNKQLETGQFDIQVRAKIIDDAVSLYECLLDTGKGKDAWDLLNLTATEVPTGRTYFSFMERAERLGQLALAHEIVDKGIETVKKEKGILMLTRAKAKIGKTSELPDDPFGEFHKKRAGGGEGDGGDGK